MGSIDVGEEAANASFKATDANDAVTTGTDDPDTLVKLQLESGVGILWNDLSVTVSLDGGDGQTFVCGLSADDKCQIRQVEGMNSEYWEPGEIVFLDEGTVDLCQDGGCTLGLEVSLYGNDRLNGPSSIVVA
jgi:hypothetical protein